ncbi:MAG: ribbon-helix-helix domain-containing protein [Paludibacteraceae bacterium]|nr:ribbon-helix-helix domain-containing protein [Paludibacteraceae bacterium]
MAKAPREHRISILLNDKEQQTLDRFCEKYGISNRSRLIRETLIRAILKQLENDQPTLFD